MVHHDLDRTCRIVASDLPFEKARPYFDNWPKHSGPSFMDALTHEGWRDVPVSYLLCEQDVCLSPEFQRSGIEMIEKETGRKVDVTRLEAGHAPNVSQPEKVLDWIVKMAELEAK
jgi:hypothetical protein